MANKPSVKSSRKSSTSKRKKSSSRQSRPSWFGRILRRLFKWGLVFSLLASIPFSAWVWWLNSQVVTRFEGQKWQVPSEVYSAPIILKSGSPWKKQDLESLLQETGYRFGRNSQKVGWAARSRTKVSAHLRSYVDHLGFHTSERRIFSFKNGLLDIRALNNQSIEEARIEPQRIGFLYGGNTENREILAYEDIPKPLIDILIAVEDRDFYQHWGISLTGIVRAIVVNVTNGARRQGGSTLTQQLIKNMYLSSERTYTRKLTEVVMSLLLEYHYSKEAIITAYMNEVYLAQLGSSALHGFAAASQHFFGRPLGELNVDEFALLVGMVKGPSLYNPERSPKRAKERRDTVLAVLKAQQRLSTEDYKTLINQPIRLADKKKQRSVYGDYLDLVAMQLSRDFDETTLATQNLRIYTGLDIRAQRAAKKAVQRQVALLERQDPKLKGLQGAMVVTDRITGQVRAVIGSSGQHYTGFNRVLGAVRPIGSLVKPPLYLSALASGRYSWWSKIEDKPLRFNVGGQIWQPENYDHKSHGVVHLYQAMAKSYNLATLNLANQIGFDRVGDTLRQLGVKRPFTMHPAMALGALELSPFEVSRLYQPIASQGQSSELGVVLAVMDQKDQLIKRFDKTGSVPFTDALLAVTLDGMTKTPKIGTARAAQGVFPKLNFAAKTGTTNQQKDSWFVGITGDYSSIVWLGDDDNVPLSITGSSGAQKVWIDFTQNMNPRSLPDSLPNGAVRYDVLDDKFEIAAPRCDDKTSLAFIVGTEPKDTSSCLWPF
ncbi:transglycosylase domain-containing protein [Marinomonas transparens]|uniref:Penicillin-binding protein 1B n=1 Tax=Marinomonas transparens TaxID=2795388 RepID=A0A934N6T2_9GAMM|nr:transglycosylase domain-containing protein [Marinomonas transparens]MBJ7538361.1 transglycosylase domain-containing protein [Marinomonas transparens]